MTALPLDWRRAGPGAYTAEGVYDGQWYGLRRHDAKRWGATFHDGDESKPVGGGTFDAVRRACAEHAEAYRAAVRRELWLRGLKVGDIVTAGAGMPAELRLTYTPGQRTAVVRWIHPDGPGWQHAQVPWATIQPKES